MRAHMLMLCRSSSCWLVLGSRRPPWGDRMLPMGGLNAWRCASARAYECLCLCDCVHPKQVAALDELECYLLPTSANCAGGSHQPQHLQSMQNSLVQLRLSRSFFNKTDVLDIPSKPFQSPGTLEPWVGRIARASQLYICIRDRHLQGRGRRRQGDVPSALAFSVCCTRWRSPTVDRRPKPRQPHALASLLARCARPAQSSARRVCSLGGEMQ
jgi:hypothetical protein